MGTKDGNNDYEADNTKEGEEGGGYTAVKDGNGDEDDKDDDEEDVMDVLPPPSSPQSQASQMSQYREREGNGTTSERESGAGDELFGSKLCGHQGRQQ